MMKLLLWLKSRPWLVAIGAALVALAGMATRLWWSTRRILKLENANDRARVNKNLEDERAAAASEIERIAASEREWIKAAERGAAAKAEQESLERTGRDRARRWGAKP